VPVTVAEMTYPPRTTVMEFVQGVSLTEYLIDRTTVWADYFRGPSAETAEGVSRHINCVVRNALTTITRLVDEGWLHADLHTGNIMVTPLHIVNGCPGIRLIDFAQDSGPVTPESESLKYGELSKLVASLSDFSSVLDRITSATPLLSSDFTDWDSLRDLHAFAIAVRALGRPPIPISTSRQSLLLVSRYCSAALRYQPYP
jgi:hypothetical protein